MSEFDEFARDLRAQHAANLKSHKDEQEAAAEQRRIKREQAKAILIAEVLPILEDAANAFRRQGYKVEIKLNWEGSAPVVSPGISMQAFGQKQRPYGQDSYETSGKIAGVSHDGDEMTVSLSPSNHNPLPGTRRIGSDLDAVKAAARGVLSSLIEECDPRKS